MPRLKSTKNRGIRSLLAAIVLTAISFLYLRGAISENMTTIASNFNNRTTILSPIYADSLTLYSSTFSTILHQNGASVLSGNTGVTTIDPRVVAMRKFLIDFHSPLYPYSDVFVETADKVELDWRLVASISGVESAFGNLIPYRSNNAWGWRGGPAGAYSNFTSWKEGIATVTTRLALGYGTTLTPFDIEPTYCPPCGRNPQHAWANGVTRFMNELDYYLENLESL